MEAIKPQNEKVSYLICTNKHLNPAQGPFQIRFKESVMRSFWFCSLTRNLKKLSRF